MIKQITVELTNGKEAKLTVDKEQLNTIKKEIAGENITVHEYMTDDNKIITDLEIRRIIGDTIRA